MDRDQTAQKIVDAGDAGLWDAAEQKLLRLLQDDPADMLALDRMATICRQRGNRDRAAVYYQRIDELSGNVDANFLASVLGQGEAPSPPPQNMSFPAPIVTIPDFLAPSVRERLDQLVKERSEQLEPLAVSISEEGEFARDRHDPGARLQLGLYCQAELDSILGASIRSTLPDLIRRLHIASFEPGDITLRLDCTPDGGYGGLHQDVGFGARLSFLYYFHSAPKRFEGGDLLIHDQLRASNEPAIDRFTRVVHEDNLLVAFDPVTYHQVTTVRALVPDLDRSDLRLSVCGFVHGRGLDD